MFVWGTTVFWYSRPGKHPLSAHLLSAHFRSLPGKAPTFRAPLSRPKSTPPSATGLREPPYKPTWLRETPYAIIGVLPVVSGVFTTKFTARAGIPLQSHYPDSDYYTVGGLPKKAHKSIYIQRISTALLSCAVDQSPSFLNNIMITSDHH